MQDGIKIRSRLGDNISGYSVVAQYKEKVVLAIATNPNTPDGTI